MSRWLALLLLWPAVAADTAPDLPAVIERVRRGYQSGEAMRVMSDVYRSDRYFTFPRFHETAEYLKNWMLKAGFSGSEALKSDLQEYVRSRLAAHEYPRIVEFVAELPLTATGKIIRRALRSARK